MCGQMDKLDGLIVILGSPNSDTGELSSIARERCLLALDLHRQHPTYLIAPTGGFGAHFNRSQRPHGSYVRENLIQNGVPGELVLDPVESSNTIEDARLTWPLIERLMPRQIIVITSDYHLERARFVFRLLLGTDVTWCCSRTDRNACTEDLAALEAHERRALAHLMAHGIPPTDATGEGDMFKPDTLSILGALDEVVPTLQDHLRKGPAPLDSRPSVSAEFLLGDIEERIKHISESVVLTAQRNSVAVAKAIKVFQDWMTQGTVVRVMGAGRARLAASIPANRLAHGGARVFVQDDIVPMPHSIKGGGILAASASGRTQTLLDDLAIAKSKGTALTIVGIAAHGAIDFQKYCDIFIGIHESPTVRRPLQALADVGEYVISELLDAVVVAAGQLAGFDETTWRLGHEDLGPTGPYGLKRGR